MKAILGWGALTVVVGLLGLALVMLGIMRRKFPLIIPGILLLMAATVGAGAVVTLAVQRTADRMEQVLAPRPGGEIYEALFGPPEGCVQVIDAQDQIIPKLDAAIRLRVNTCPAEVRRVLLQHAYAVSMELADKDTTDRFSTASFGDSVLTCSTTIVEGRNWRTLMISRDSTRMIVVDSSD
ncbi:MAG TPA: hypothetical protein PLN54_01135 [Flavobacteriales bacterium]|nr:hypothetical protein [Flavobacteriales bacterium]